MLLSLLNATGLSEAVGSATEVRGLGLQAPSQPFPQFCLLCIPAHQPLDVQMCQILQCPVLLGRGTFVELWMFYTLQD